MAGDWIKLEAVTPDKPEVFAIAEKLGCEHGAAFLACVRFWLWADQQSLNGHDLSVTKMTVDHVARVTGFANALLEVGWLEHRGTAISIPNFDRHNGKTAKERALATKRKVTERSRSQRDNSVTREEKRRSTPIAPTGGFLKFWGAWPKSARKQSRGQCWERWRKADFDLVADEIIAHVEAMKLTIDWRKDSGAFIPAPLVYLNGRRWEGADLSPGGEKRMVV